MEVLTDDPPVTQIEKPAVRTATPVVSRVVDPAAIAAKPEAHKDKTLFNDMANKLTEALKGNPDAVKPTETPTPKPDEEKGKEKDQEVVSRKSEDWRKLHSRVKEVEAKSENLGKELQAKVAEIEALKKQPVIDPKELDSLKTEKAELLGQLEKLNLAESPAFKSFYERKFTKAMTMAKESVTPEQHETIEYLLNAPASKQRKEALAGILENLPDEMDRQSLARAVHDMDDARAERTAALGEAKANLAKAGEFQKNEAIKQSNAQKARMEEKIKAVLALKTHFGAFTPIEGNEAHNNSIAGREADVRRALAGELPENELAVMPLLASEAVYLKGTVVPTLESKIKSLEESIAKLSGAQPGQGHGDPTNVDKKAKTFVEKFNELYQGPQRRSA